MTEPLLLYHLAAFVPLEILNLELQGGPSDWHFEEARKRMVALNATAEASESLLYPVSQKRLTARSIGVLVECLAVIAFVPGGVKFGSLHFEGKQIEIES